MSVKVYTLVTAREFPAAEKPVAAEDLFGGDRLAQSEAPSMDGRLAVRRALPEDTIIGIALKNAAAGEDAHVIVRNLPGYEPLFLAVEALGE